MRQFVRMFQQTYWCWHVIRSIVHTDVDLHTLYGCFADVDFLHGSVFKSVTGIYWCHFTYVCTICWRWWFICQHTNLLIRTKLPPYVIFTNISICNQCVHQYVQVMSTLACVRICVYRLTKYNNQPSLLWTIDHCPIIIFFLYRIVEPFVLSFLVEQCQKKIHQAQVKQNNKQWGRENLLKTYRVEAMIR